MKGKGVFLLAAAGLLIAIVSAVLFSVTHRPLPPAFAPAANPYPSAIYAEGIIESAQASGENVNLNPEVSGPVAQVLVREGQRVDAGDALLVVDESIQRATYEQQQHQAEAADALLAELKAQPRPEALHVAEAQSLQAEAARKLAEDQRDKQRRSFSLDPRSVSKEALDTAENNAKVAIGAADVAKRQLELTKAGAWAYDIQNQARQYQALTSAAAASRALLDKYVIRAPTAGVVLAINAAVGGYVSGQGVYDTYTQAQLPVVVMGQGGQGAGADLEIRCYVDEILVQQLPPGDQVRAEMTVRGSSARVPLQFVRVQPYLSPKIELSDERQERVDLRVLPVIFHFRAPPGLVVYPGQLADVFIGRAAARARP